MSDRERRRIAGDLHDGPVQELAGLSMRLSAAAETTSDSHEQAVLRESASAVRGSVRTMRSAIVGIYPPNLRSGGTRSGSRGPHIAACVRKSSMCRSRSASRAASARTSTSCCTGRARRRCAMSRSTRARPRSPSGSTREHSSAVLEVVDDGRGIDPTGGAPAEGHLGLQIVEDLVRDAGGTVSVSLGRTGRYGRACGGADVVIRVAIADDHRVVRVGSGAAARQPSTTSSWWAPPTAARRLWTLAPTAQPDVLLLDLSMPDLDGIGVTKRMADGEPRHADRGLHLVQRSRSRSCRRSTRARSATC